MNTLNKMRFGKRPVAGYAYMVKPAVIEKVEICKVGRTGDPIHRMACYGKGRFVHAIAYVSNQVACEKSIMTMFKKRYKQRVDLGSEYFEGDVDEMLLMR